MYMYAQTQTDRQTERQTDTPTCTHTHMHMGAGNGTTTGTGPMISATFLCIYTHTYIHMYCVLTHTYIHTHAHGGRRKWNNNWDWSDDQRNTPQAFSHFTWEASGHKLLVCDLQGVGDLWTDPQIHTHDRYDAMMLCVGAFSGHV
jgi:hypothetical protein